MRAGPTLKSVTIWSQPLEPSPRATIHASVICILILIQFKIFNYYIIFICRKEAAQQVLNNIGPFEELPTASSEYAFDFYDSSSSFGSQLILKSTASEFDDLPGFVSGKVLYFLKDSTAIQPYSVRYYQKKKFWATSMNNGNFDSLL